MKFLLFVLLLGAALLIFIRFVPGDITRLHLELPDRKVGSYSGPNSHVEVLAPISEDTFGQIVGIAAQTPRTKLIAGSIQDARVTFVTRSKLIGFPDYTTIQLVEEKLTINARSRFGYGDHGVNRARVRDWLRRAGLS